MELTVMMRQTILKYRSKKVPDNAILDWMSREGLSEVAILR